MREGAIHGGGRMTPGGRGLAVLMAGAAITALANGAALAGATQSGPPAADPSAELPVVVVTAQKRSEDLQKVPISMTVMNSADLTRLGAQDLRQIEYSVPNLIFTSVDNSVNPEVSIRGISSDARNIGFESGVSMYVDGVYTGRPASFTSDMLGVQQIEVLRGPQGTLFGKNTTAGAINVTTAQPSDAPKGEAELEYGAYNAFVARAMVAGPIVGGALDGELGAFYRRHDGYETNLANDRKYYGENVGGGQGKLRYEPDARTSVTFALDGLAEHYRPDVNEMTPGSFGYVAGQNPRDVNIDAAAMQSRQVFGASMTAERKLASGAALTSITAYRFANTHFLSDDDGSPEPFLTSDFTDDQDQFSQELRLTSPSHGRFRYVAGLFFYDEDVRTDRASVIPPDTLAGPDGVAVTLTGAVRTLSYAAYGQADYDITPALTLTAGLRYTAEHKSMHMDLVGSPLFNIIDLNTRQTLNDSNVSPMVTLSYKLTETVNAYAKFAEGFKSGGFNVDFVSADQIRFKPETVDSYEAGLKSQIGDRARLDLAAFYMNYDNLQVESFEQLSGFVISNAATAHIWGLELDGLFDVAPGLRINAGLGYLNATFSSYPNGGGAGIDYTGNQLPIAPRWTGNIGAEYRREIAGAGEGYVGVSYAYRDRYYTDASNAADTLLAGYGLLDARIGLRSQDRRWTIEVWGKNLTDKLYATDRGTPVLGGLLGQHFISYGAPRTYGLRLAAKF